MTINLTSIMISNLTSIMTINLTSILTSIMISILTMIMISILTMIMTSIIVRLSLSILYFVHTMWFITTNRFCLDYILVSISDKRSISSLLPTQWQFIHEQTLFFLGGGEV